MGEKIMLSVVIPCYNGAATLADQLDALTQQEWDHPWEIVFSNNGSTDGSEKIAAKYARRMRHLRIVDASARRGQPFALNTGIMAAASDAIALCDADDQVGERWVVEMGEALRTYDFVACRVEAAKLNPPWLQGCGQNDGLQNTWYPPWLPHAGGGTIGFRRRIFELAGPFDEALPYLHDTEFCLKAQLNGVKIQFIPGAVLHLRKRTTLKAHYRQARNYAEYNAILARRYWPREQEGRQYYESFFRGWINLVKQVPETRSLHGRFHWIWQLGWQIGRLRGWVKHRAVPV